MARCCDAFMAADGVAAGVAVVPANWLRRGVAASHAAFLDSIEDSIVVMKSLEESIRDMEKERQQVIKTKAKLSQKLRNARQRLARLKKSFLIHSPGRAHVRAQHGEVLERISVASEPTAAELAIRDAELKHL